MRNRVVRLRSTGAWLLLAIGTSFSTVAHAGAGVWTSGGPNGGTVNALAINPSTPSTVYAGTGNGGVFKSTDSGNTWAAANAGLTGPGVNALAINPSTPSTLYAAGSDAVFKSTDSGGTWAAALELGTYYYYYSAKTLAINPSTPSTLYVGTDERGLQVHQLRRHLGRRQHGTDEPGRPRSGHQSLDPRHALRRDG